MTNQLERNKHSVKEFYDLAFNLGKPAEAIETYAGEKYIQHNPGEPDGKQAFVDYFNRLAKEYPAKRVHFKRLIAEENYVAVHTHQE
jgi:predicted SnoaL-like aldol condensation-catalyzing enzyme